VHKTNATTQWILIEFATTGPEFNFSSFQANITSISREAQLELSSCQRKQLLLQKTGNTIKHTCYQNLEI
jgi:hypothetical protein